MIDYDDLHRKRIKKYTAAIEKAFSELIAQTSSLAMRAKLTDELFQFRKHPYIIKGIDKALSDYRKSVMDNITLGTSNEWEFANLKSDAIKEALLERVKDKVTPETLLEQHQKIARSPRNLEALKAFQERKKGKFTTSERVWKIEAGIKKELEFALDIALTEGKSAQQLAREIKKYLVHPDKLFRKVRDKHGNLVLSKNAEVFHPGQGVYRSSHKNALRLAANEINIAYRESEQMRIMANNDIVGQLITLSPQHAVYDMCDELQGEYPKDFVWSKWHVNCKCHRRSILKSDEEFIRELNNGQELPPESSKNFVKAPPKAFNEWISNNAEKMQNWKSKPDFITDNPKYVDMNSMESAPSYDKAMLDLNISNDQSNEIFMRRKELELERDDLNELFDLLAKDENPTLGELLKTKKGEKILEILGIKASQGKAAEDFSGVELSFDEIYDKFDESAFDNWEKPGNTAVGQIQSMIGFKGLPKVLDESDFDNIVGEDVVTIYRGVNNVVQVEQFKSGEMYDGTGIFGNGSYFSNLKETGLHYAKDNAAAMVVAKINLKEYKVIEFNKLSKEHYSERAKALEKSGGTFSAKDAIFWSDPATYAAAKGYDAIYVQQGENEDFYVILNRTKLWIKK